MNDRVIPTDQEMLQNQLDAARSNRDCLRLQTLLRFKAKHYGQPTIYENMDELGRQARANGLTPEILDEILNEGK